MTFSPSPEQQLIFNSVQNDLPTSLLIKASAGSGKTTTIVHAASLLPRSHIQRFLAFNKSIAEELKSRLPATCEATTFHSLGFTALKNSGRRPKVYTGKSNSIVKKLCRGPKELSTYMSAACRLIGYAKNAGIGALIDDQVQCWKDLIEYHNLDCDGDELRLIEIARAGLTESNRCLNEVDFDDMLYLPVLLDLAFPKSSTVFVDEAQDTNAIQLDILKRLRFPTGRIIAVGDPSQAIYGFRGASSAALTNIKNAFNATILPLSVSYRCSQAVVNEARKFDKGTI